MFRQRPLRCSFCGRDEGEVAKLVAGPRVYICDRCVAVASRIMEEEARESPGAEAQRGAFRRLSDWIRRARPMVDSAAR